MSPSKKSQRVLFFVLIVSIGIATWAILNKIEHDARLETGQSLKAVLRTTTQGLKSWAQESKAAAKIWANYSLIRDVGTILNSLEPDPQTLISSNAQTRLRSWFKPLAKVTGYQGFFIVSRQNINLASSRDQNVGLESLFVSKPDFLEKIWLGETVLSHPYISDVPLPNEVGQLVNGMPTIFVGAPIYNKQGEIIAAFTFRLNPSTTYNHIFEQGRIGKTGESYAFDETGTMLSNSRYDDQLQSIGLLKAERRAMLNLELRDPGINLIKGDKGAIPQSQRPLTKMLESAIATSSGFNLNGYRDYRGVKVVGAWIWDEELDFGIATEQDFEEAYAALNTTRKAIILMSVLLVLLSLTLLEILAQQTRRKLAEKSAQSLLEAGPDAIVVVDKKGDITFVNDHAMVILGYTQQELVGKSVEYLLPDRHRESHANHRESYYLKPYRRAMGEGMELSARHKEGFNIPVEISLSPFETEQGTLVAAAIRDITRRKEAEGMLKEYQTELESIVAKRTSDLEATNKELESYSYSIAHDLRTPLRSITSFSQILKEDINKGATEDNLFMLGRIAQAGKNMACLIDDILELSRFTRSSVKIEEINLSNIAIEIKKELNNQDETRKIAWQIEEGLKVWGDRRLLTLVVQNLLENAWKYTINVKNPEIQFGVIQDEREQVYFVKDNGLGFDMEFENKLFKPFHRLHANLNIEGTGVGLAIVQRIIQRHGGKIWAESSEGSGATFYFKLPENVASTV